jgi:hypothetical protein
MEPKPENFVFIKPYFTEVGFGLGKNRKADNQGNFL